MTTTMTNNKAYKRIIAAFCIFLAMCMGLIMPLQVYAASTDVTYLSDIKLYCADNAEDAKKGLEGEGYTFQSGNLNAGTERDTEVYLGYKTTTNPDMAITDIRMLGMESGFQLYDYNQMVEYLKNEKSGAAYTMVEASKEFTQNYEKNSPKAISAYKGLNYFYVDEAEMKLGDYIIAGKANLDFYMSMVLKSSAGTLNAVLTLLNAGVAPYENSYDEQEGEVVSENWAEQLPESTVYYMLDNNPTADELKDMKKQYNDNARETFKQIQTFVMEYENSLARNPDGNADTSIKTAEQAVENADDVSREDADVVYVKAFDKLNEYSFTEDMTVGEWILDLGHQTSDEVDLTELYPLVDVMSDAQNDIIGDTGFLSAVSNLGENEKASSFEGSLSQLEEEIDNFNKSDAISVWDNADDDIQSSKIAFTSEAVRRQSANNLIIKHDETDTFAERFELIMKWVGFSIGMLSIAVFVSAKIITAIATAATSAVLSETMASLISVVGVIGAVGMWAGVVAAVVTVLVMIALAIVSLLDDDDDPEEYIELPGYIIDAQTGADGKTTTVRYKTVMSNKEKDGKYYGDLNGWEETRWNTLGYTRDKAAGSPIRMDEDNTIFKIVQGDSNTPNGYAPLRPFGERSAGNCNTYCKNDNNGGVYVFYRTEKSMQNESPGSEESSTDEKAASSGYLATLLVATADSEAQAKAKINKQSTKYYIYDVNLSPNMDYATYLAYTITMDSKNAITDIRVAPYNGNNSVTYGDAQYVFAGTVGTNMGSGESNASSPNDALLYTTDEKAGSPVLADSFHVTNSTKDAKAGWEPVTPFACGIPYSFNVTHVKSSAGNGGYITGMSGIRCKRVGTNWYDYVAHWDHIKDVYLYFEPSVQYTGGEKYISGVFFVSGFDIYKPKTTSEENYSFKFDTLDAYINKFKGMGNVEFNNVNLAASIKSPLLDKTPHAKELKQFIAYSYTYNPKRAIYDFSLFQGLPYNTSLPYSVSKKQADSSTINYIASTTYCLNGGYHLDYSFRMISNLNSFMNNQAGVVDTKMTEEIINDHFGKGVYYTKYTADNIEYGYSKMTYPTVGLYAAGYTKNKEPLRLCDLVITTNEYTAEVDGDDITVNLEKEKTLDGQAATGAFRSITNIQNPHSLNAFNFAYPDTYLIKGDSLYKKGSKLYVYQRGAARTKGKYIASLSLGAYSKELYQNGVNSKKDSVSLEGIKYSTDMYSLMGACSTSADEVLIQNLAVKQSNGWYNCKDGDGRQSLSPSGDSSAYIGVTRTDNPNKAIRGALLVQNDKWTTERTIKIGRVVYYCDSIQSPMRLNGHNYYLYYTYNTGVNAGQPIEDISIDGMPLVQGAATAICAKDSDVENERKIYTDINMPSFLHMYYDHSNIKGVFFNKLYVATGKTKSEALLELTANECVEFLDLDLNDGASGKSVYFGYRYGVLDQTAISKQKTEEAKEQERRDQMQEAICDIVVTQGEPYQPDGFIAENYVYYKPVADKNLNEGNLGDELYMYYTSDYVSDSYNRKNNAATYLAMDLFSPIKAFAFTRYDCVPYNKDYARKSNNSELLVYEYVMRSDEKMAIDLNADILVTDGDGDSKGDNRIYMFVSRYNNRAKRSAEITGGYVGKTTDVGELKIVKP